MEKRCAVEKEDYDLAKKKKQQMEAYRLKVYQQLELHDLLDAELMASALLPDSGGFSEWVLDVKVAEQPKGNQGARAVTQGSCDNYIWILSSLLGLWISPTEDLHVAFHEHT